MGIMEKKMETTMVITGFHWGYIGVIGSRVRGT